MRSLRFIMILQRLLSYLNPIKQLGKRNYSFGFPLFTATLTAFIIELWAYGIAHDPNAVGISAIFVFVALIIYFAFHDGIRGGLITTLVTIFYYFYIIDSRQYTGQQLTTSIETTLFLAALYLLLAGTIGWLKETIDRLIEQEADEKKRLQAVIQQLPVGVIITDSKGHVVQANKQMEIMLGVKVPVGFIVGKEAILTSTYQGKRTTPSQSPLAQSLATGKPVVGKEYIIERKDGKNVFVQINASAIHNRKGKIIAAASIITDITAQREMEQRKDDFVNMASHELKTPITSMKLYIDSLKKRLSQSNDPRAKKTISSIKYQTERLQELVSDLLDVSRLQTGKLTFTKEELPLHLLIKETVDQLQGSTDKNILYKINTRVRIIGDRFRIYQVLTNLITNAVKYSPEGKNIIVRLKKERTFAIISVQDFGIGISKEQQRKIFDRLYQVTDPTEKTFPGLGLGLYISSEIVKRHRGKIWVESKKGKGSTFSFRLPLSKKGE